MIDEVRQKANHDEFISLLRSIDREGADIEKLISKLESSDFFVAPASTTYHCAFQGGLAEHSLNVYYNLMHLVKYKEGFLEDCFDENSIKIVALLHDISKINTYEKTVKNKKVYDPMGNQSDKMGRYDWVSEEGYKKKDVNETFVYGSHEMTSEYMVSKFIPLTVAESTAILHHMGGMAFDSAKDNIGAVYNRYPLACLLYLADMLSTYTDERLI